MRPSGRVALLDVNVLVALFDSDHVHHDLAHDWFADNQSGGWATCPITENGFVRVVSNPGYGSHVRGDTLIASLRRFCGSEHHHFWAETLSITDTSTFNLALVLGHRQLTDVYLLGLTKKMGGRLATFDRTVPLRAVVGAKAEHLEIITPHPA